MSRLLRDDIAIAIAPRDDDEGLFSRDINGQLVRLDTPTEADYGKSATLQIDGQPVTVPLAEPLKDAQGNILVDIQGRTTPRYTTIYDAAVKLYVQQPGDEAKIPIPILCHQPHMTPVAVCRLCVVQIYGQKRGKRAAERKLLPACQHAVKPGMEVFTMNAPGPDGDRVRMAVKLMTELLTADHLKAAPPPAPADELAPFNELKQMQERCGLQGSRFSLDLLAAPKKTASPAGAPLPAHRPLDVSSPVFLVDHSACILCDRCVRACDEVKQNNVIGRTGKGAAAGIGFDLDLPMGDSSCVQCGECMVSCPTSAITFKPVGQVKLKTRGQDVQVLSAAELTRDGRFAGVPPKFLLWQEGLVLRRRVKEGEVLFRQGDPGNSAFLIRSGRLEVTAWPPESRLRGSLLSRMAGLAKQAKPLVRIVFTPADVILGEMSCLRGIPRSADVTALEDSELWEVRRNVLDRIMRSPTQRGWFEGIYHRRALEVVFRGSELFSDLPADEHKRCVEFLLPRLSFVRVNPGQMLFKQGDWADNLYLVRLGHVRVAIHRGGREISVVHRGPGSIIGEIGLLAIAPEDARRNPAEIDRELGDALENAGDPITAAIPAAQRTATCSALDHLELARLGRADFLRMVHTFPALRRRLVELSIARLRRDGDFVPVMAEYVQQGLYQGQSLLVLDLTSCTRCDECTRACAEQHGTESHGVELTRLNRDGLRFGDYLVATACRSCKDPYCMVGCPVDSIHRGKHLQIIIEDHCIGCGLCAQNCPYGNIWMVPNENTPIATPDPLHPGQTRMIPRPKAATCDLCDAEGTRDVPLPRCVYACPHDAAHRMTGEQLLEKVMEKERGRT